jgi:hypothetical protein
MQSPAVTRSDDCDGTPFHAYRDCTSIIRVNETRPLPAFRVPILPARATDVRLVVTMPHRFPPDQARRAVQPARSGPRCSVFPSIPVASCLMWIKLADRQPTIPFTRLERMRTAALPKSHAEALPTTKPAKVAKRLSHKSIRTGWQIHPDVMPMMRLLRADRGRRLVPHWRYGRFNYCSMNAMRYMAYRMES